MNIEQVAALKRTLSLVGRTRDSLAFLYTPAAEDGLPLLLAEVSRISPRAILMLTSTARSQDFVRGQICREGGRLVLQIQDGSRGLPMLIEHLDGLLGAQVPELKIAVVRPAE